MPRPMMPAPITATVRTSVTRHSLLLACRLFFFLLARLLEVLNHALITRFGLADIFTKAGALLFGHRRNAGADAAQGGGDVVDVVHEADEFSSCGHEGSLRIFWRVSGNRNRPPRSGNYSLFNIHCSTGGRI